LRLHANDVVLATLLKNLVYIIEKDAVFHEWMDELDVSSDLKKLLYQSVFEKDFDSIDDELRFAALAIEDAERIVMGVDDSLDSQESETVGLRVIFDSIAFDTEQETGAKHIWQPLLLEERPYPVSASEQETVKLFSALWQRAAFGLREALKKKENLQEDRLLLLYEKYLSQVPIASKIGKATADVSLYHHSKVTAAVARCLYLFMRDKGEMLSLRELSSFFVHHGEGSFLLIQGDLSGIQNFVYTIGSKAALKTVRARSFYLDLLIESAASQLLERLNLGRANLVYASGGGFTLLAPNTKEVRDAVTRFRESFNHWLFEQFGMKLYLALAAVPLSVDELSGKGEGLSQVYRKVGEQLSQQKMQKWNNLIHEEHESFFGPHHVEAECEVCHHEHDVRRTTIETVSEEESYDLCAFCRQAIELGRLLQKPDTIRLFELYDEADTLYKSNTIKIRIFTAQYALTNQQLNDAFHVPSVKAEYRLHNPWSFPDEGKWPTKPFPMGALVYESQVHELAQQALGDKKIGILRMDMDRVGRIFSRGLRKNTFARMSDLSTRLNVYFKYYLPFMLENLDGGLLPVKPRRVPVNLIYAGGDDLFMMGTWDGVLEAAMAIQADFRRYTGNNPDVTLSAGIVIADEKRAFYRLADLAGESEHHAKKAGRNRVALFQNVLTWEDVSGNIRRALEVFKPQLEQQGLEVRPISFSHSFLNRYALLVENYAEYGAWVFPQIYYLFARAKKKDCQPFFHDLFRLSMNEKDLKVTLPMTLKIMKLLLRGGANDGRNSIN